MNQVCLTTNSLPPTTMEDCLLSVALYKLMGAHPNNAAVSTLHYDSVPPSIFYAKGRHALAATSMSGSQT